MAKIHIWMAIDPETRRVMVQAREFADGDFPRGLRGVGWPMRELDVDAATWDGILANKIIEDEADTVHRSWWNAAARPGQPAWPYLPGEEPTP